MYNLSILLRFILINLQKVNVETITSTETLKQKTIFDVILNTYEMQNYEKVILQTIFHF